jgi:GNAT superfamily N-acetyltransferase
MKDQAFQIRQAVLQDSDQILACLRTAFAPYENLYTPAAFADTVLDALTINARMQRMHMLVATVGDQVVGTVSGALCDDDEGHLRGMAVLPEYQSSGAAKNLLRAIEQWLKENGCKQVTLDTTLPLARAMNFYEKNGYERSGRTTDFFGMTLIEYAKDI